MKEKPFITERNFWAIDLYIGIIALWLLKQNIPSLSEEHRRKYKRFQNMLNIRDRIRKEATVETNTTAK